MVYLLVRNRVEDYDRWKAVFDANLEAGLAAGLTLRHLWRKLDDPEDVYFVLEVRDRAAAEAYMSTPESAESGRVSGVIDGEYHFLMDSGDP